MLKTLDTYKAIIYSKDNIETLQEGGMIQEFINRYMEGKNDLIAQFSQKHPEGYLEIVRAVVEVITTKEYRDIDPERIHEIDYGDYQGTLLYIIASKGYQPSDYWSLRIFYGSCSGCDTLEAITEYSNKKPTEEQVKDYMTLALHIVQGIQKIGGEIV